MIARSSAYAYFLETIIGQVRDVNVEEKGCQENPCGTTFLKDHNLLRLPVVGVKVRLPTISMIMQAMCSSGSNRSSLQVRP